MNKILAALTGLLLMSLSEQAGAVSFTIDGGNYSDSLRTTLAHRFDVGQTIYGRLILGIESDVGDPLGASITEPMDLFLDQVFDDLGDIVNPASYVFDPGSPTGVGPSVIFDYTLVFDGPSLYQVQFFTSIAMYDFGGGPVFDADPGPLSFNVAVPEPGTFLLFGLGLLGLGLFGLGMKRWAA